MPRFFPSFHRSRDRARDDYTHFENHPQYDTRESQASAWRRVIPGQHENGNEWQEEFMDYPESYTGHDGPYGRAPNRPVERDYMGRPARGYDVRSESTVTATDDHYDARYYSRDNAIPIVQRESSLSRLREVFSDHVASNAPGPRPVTEVSLPTQGTPMHSPVDMQPLPPPPPPPLMTPITPVTQQPPPVEIRNVYPQQAPIFVQNSTPDSEEGDIRMQRSRNQSTRNIGRSSSRYPSSRATDMRREASSSGRSLGHDDDLDYPPCVVVVERGHRGKPDTYYVIPGGAPVIFEDQHGNELTRVGDFSGRYRPKKQRPVIIEDEHGQEIGRLGFDDESSLDYTYRNHSDDSLNARGRTYDFTRRYDGRDAYNRASTRARSSQDPQPQPRGLHSYRTDAMSRGGSIKPTPNLVFIPYSDQQARGTSRHSGRSSSSRHHNDYPPSLRSYESSNVIHLEDCYRQRRETGSVSSRSSGSTSYGSSRRR